MCVSVYALTSVYGCACIYVCACISIGINSRSYGSSVALQQWTGYVVPINYCTQTRISVPVRIVCVIRCDLSHVHCQCLCVDDGLVCRDCACGLCVWFGHTTQLLTSSGPFATRSPQFRICVNQRAYGKHSVPLSTRWHLLVVVYFRIRR